MNGIDLFAGAGGFTEGARAAGVTVLWAANHWPEAVKIHASNHRATAHSCQDLQQCDWTTVPGHDLLLAAPACQGHAYARGIERPHHDAQRATAWAVVSAAECHRPQGFVVENVTEFARWALYRPWCSAMHALGYALSPYIIDAADHGVPQHRTRLFIVGTLSKHPIELDLPRRPHIPASSVIDFEAGTWSPIRRRGRSPKTLARVRAGRSRFGDRFVMPYYGSGSGETGRDLERPLGTITTHDRWAVIDGNHMRMLTKDEVRAAMGFPAGYRVPKHHRTAVHMLGNAVCPPVARDVITALREAA